MAVIYYLDQEGNYVKKNGGGYKGFPMLKQRKLWAGTTSTSTITEVRFVEQYAPDNYDEKWDAGVDPSTITAYREGDVVTVSANGKRQIKLNPGSNGMFNSFYRLKSIKGLEMLDASDVTHIGGMFVYCKELTSVDMSMWHLGKVTKAGGVFQYCYNLRSVKMPHGLHCDTLTTTESMFEECLKLVEVDMGNGPAFLSPFTFKKCINLERVIGLGNVTSIGARAFIYCAKLKDIDLNPAIITSIGESAFRLSSMEDCINMYELPAGCQIGNMATRSARWPDFKMLAAVQDKIVPTVTLRVPHADTQKKYSDMPEHKFGYYDTTTDGVDNPVDVPISSHGCSALSLYHVWQCVHHGTDLQKDNFLEYWAAFKGDKFVDRNDRSIGNFIAAQSAILGWEHEEARITGTDQYDVILERLRNRQPTCVIMNSANSGDEINPSEHVLVVVGGDTLTGKLLLVDSSISQTQAEFVWVKFEDIFTADADDRDRVIIHTFDV